MAFIENQDEDEEKAQQPGQQAPAPLQLNAGTAAPATSTPAPAAYGAPQQSQSAGQAPGRYTNFQQYFNANKDAAAATGAKLASGIEAQGAAVQKELGQRQNAFGQQVGASLGTAAASVGRPAVGTTGVGGTRAPGPGQARDMAPAQTSGARAAAPTGPGPATQANAAPVPDANKPPPAKYTGPGSLAESPGWDYFLGKAGRVAGDAAQTATGSGLQALLQKQAASSPATGGLYSQGKGRFDAGLTGAASGDKFSKLREAFGGLPASVSNANTASLATSGAAAKQVADANTAFKATQDAVAAAKSTPAPEAAPEDPNAPHDRAVQAAIADYGLKDKERGEWGQFDPFGNGDARQFIRAAQGAGLDLPDEQLKALYEGMTPDEYSELVLMEGGAHPDSPVLEGSEGWGDLQRSRKQDDFNKAKNEQIRAFLEKMKAKYVKE